MCCIITVKINAYTQVLKNLVTTGFKGIACMLPVGDLEEAVDDVLSLHCLSQSPRGPLSYYFQWPPVAFHHKFSTTPANFPLGKACCSYLCGSIFAILGPILLKHDCLFMSQHAVPGVTGALCV